MSRAENIQLRVGNRVIIATDYGKSNDYEVMGFEELPNGRIAMIVRKVEDLP